jgi:hypothetical protein
MSYTKPSSAENLQYHIDAYTADPSCETQDNLLTATRLFLAKECPNYIQTLKESSTMDPDMSVLPVHSDDPATMTHRFEHAGQRSARRAAWISSDPYRALTPDVRSDRSAGPSQCNHKLITWGV